MRLDFNAFKIIQANTVDKSDYSKKGDKPEIVKPAKTTVQRIIKALTDSEALTVLQLVELTGISQPVVYRSLGCMKKDGLINKTETKVIGRRAPARFSLTGVDVSEAMATWPTKPRVIQKNNKSGLTGVHYNKSTGRWHATHGRGKSYPFNNLLDAACCRKSLELNNA